MTDQMPRGGQIVGAYALHFPLLHAIFAKVADAGLIGFVNSDGRMGFGNADKRDVFSATAGAGGGAGDLLLDAKQVFTNGGVGHGLPFTFTVHSLQLTVRERKAYVRQATRWTRILVALQRGLSQVRLASTGVRLAVH